MSAFRAISYSGVGSPNGVVIGSPGDFYTDTAGGVGATLWLKQTGINTNTGWSLLVFGVPPASWSQAAWFIDPANSTGLANDNNSGLDVGHPVLSYSGGVAAKWGTNSPVLRQNTTLTWLSSQTGNSDPVIFTPIMEGAGGASSAGFIATIMGLGPVYNSGAGASISAFNAGQHKATVVGLAGMQASDVGNYMTLTNAVSPGNDGTFLITNFISATSVQVFNLTGSIDAGPINWAVRRTGGVLLGSGALASVVAKNRATPQLLAADIGFNTPNGVGLIRNTTAGKLSYAWLYNNTVGTTYTMSQPMTPVALPVQAIGFTSEVNTWANGDTFEVYMPVSITLVEIGATVAVSDAPNFPPQIQANHLSFVGIDAANAVNSTVVVRSSVAISECLSESTVADQSSPISHQARGPSTVYENVELFEAIALNAIYSTFSAGILNAVNGSLVTWSFDNDSILAVTATVEITLISNVTYGSGGAGGVQVPYVGSAYIEQGGAANGHLRVTGSRWFENAIIWGPGTLDTSGSARISYAAAAGKASTTFINTGGLRLNGQSNANAFNPATGAWSGPLAITPAALDTAFGAGGFGGLAVNVGGSSYTNQATP